MTITVNERNGCCESIHAEYTPTEFLIINQAMRRYVDDENENEEDRAIMEQMLAVKPNFVDMERSEE